MKMRLRHAKLVIIFIVLVNLFLFYYSWKTFLWKTVLDPDYQGAINHNPLASEKPKSQKEKTRIVNKHIRKSITIVFRNFYNFENDLKNSIDSILEIIPNMPVVIIQDSPSYPPITYENNATRENTVRFINLGFDVNKSAKDLSPFLAIKTKYVLFMPDSVRLSNKNLLQKVLREINKEAKKQSANNIDAEAPIEDDLVKRMILVPFAGNIKAFSSCTEVHLDLPNWTVEYIASNTSNKCDMFLQKHSILVDIGVLKNMPDPFSSPFPEMLYIQGKIADIQKTIFPNSFQDGRRLFISYHTKQRRMEIRRKQFKEMYKKLQIKRIVRKSHRAPSSRIEPKDLAPYAQHNIVLDPQFSSSNFSFPVVTEIDLIGCERTTKSCIGPVYNLKPFYTYLGKHTPPCCLDKLKTVFNHVLDEFENVGIRYWLDNYALKSAIDTNQLSADAFDIDISFNSYDLERSNSLKKSQLKPFVDNEGFYWMKATDGHYFRVQFSKANQVGVNLLPFETSGNEVRPNGFYGWKAREFSSEFLHPMSTVLFLGKNVMCPNNVREFLEYKNI